MSSFVTMVFRFTLLLVILGLPVPACGGSDDPAPADAGPGGTVDGGDEGSVPLPDGSGSSGAPAAPSNLEVSELSGGAHLTWEDHSDDEIHFMIFRKGAAGEYEVIASPTFDSTTYHDGPLDPGTYTYYVTSMNEVSQSEPSNEASVTIP